MSFLQETWSYKTNVLQEMKVNPKESRYNFFHALLLPSDKELISRILLNRRSGYKDPIIVFM